MSRRPDRARAAAGRVASLVAVPLAAAALLAACGSSNSPAHPSSTSQPATTAQAPAGSAPTSSSGPTGTVASPGLPTSPPPPSTAGGPFPGGLLIADRGNGRVLIVDDAGRIVWSFPRHGVLPPHQSFSADDAFLSPDHRTIVANDEFHEVIDRIDLATGRIVWQYGRYGVPGSGPGELHTPDDAYPLANGDVVVADIENCRILEIRPDKSIARQWGRTGSCADRAPGTFGRPNGDTPLPDGGLLITEIRGSRVVRLAADGHVVFDIHVPVAYPSDAQLDPQGNVVVADFSTHGQVVAVNPATGTVVWRWAYRSGDRRLDHPSLATPLPDGTVSVNDDFRHRLIVIDPRAGRIVWQFGRTDHPGTGPTSLDTPDGHQPLPAGVL